MLIECPECKQRISEGAEACPKCGKISSAEERRKAIDAAKTSQRAGQIGCGVLVVMFVGLVVLFSGQDEETPRPRSRQTTVASRRYGTERAAPAPAAPARPRISPVPTGPPSSSEPEYLLAVIEAGWRVEPGDYRVAVFASLLDRLEAKTVNSRSNIADIIVRTSELAARDGRPIGVLGVAQGLDISIPPDAAGLNLQLEEVAAVWLVLHVKGL